MTLEGELFTVSSNIHNHKNRTSLKGPPPFFFSFQTSAFLINCAIPNRSFFLVNTFSLTDRESERRGEGKGEGEQRGEAEWSGGHVGRGWGLSGGNKRWEKQNQWQKVRGTKMNTERFYSTVKKKIKNWIIYSKHTHKRCLGDSLGVAWAETKQLRQELKQDLTLLQKQSLYLTSHALSVIKPFSLYGFYFV